MSGHPLLAGFEEIRRSWGWFLLLGAFLIMLGVCAISAPWVAALATVITLGWLLLIGGVLEAVSAFWARRWGGFFLHLLGGILDLVIGFLLVARPAETAGALTLLLAAFFLVGGLFRMSAAVVLRPSNWGWALLSGAVTTLLGVLIWSEWPESSFWVIGTFVGIELIFRGWWWVMLAFAARRLPAP